MAATSTFKTLLEELVEQTGIGDVLPSVTGTTTGITLANAYAAGPFPNQRYPRGSVVLTTAGTAINEASFVDQYTASTGVFTITPAVSNTFTSCIIVPFGIGIDHPDRLKEAINRALTKRLCRWQKVPLTFVPGGDMLGTTVADHWTASAGTASYAETSFPEVSGRVLNYTHTSAGEDVASNAIPVREGEVWEFETAIRAASDGDTATLRIVDVTNSEDHTVSYAAGTGSTTNRAFTTQRGQFTVRTGCQSLQFSLEAGGSGTIVVQMAPIVAYPKDARTFPLQQRVTDLDHVGNFFRSRSWSGDSGPEERLYSEPLTIGGRTVSFSEAGDHFNATFNAPPYGPVYYDELVYGTSLSAMTDTTTFASDHVLRWAKYELYKWLYDRDEKWRPKVYEARKACRSFDYRHLQEPTVVGRT